MNSFVAHLRSTNVIQALAIVAAGLVYWYTRDVALAGVAAVAIMGSVPSSVTVMIAKLENLEDAIRAGAVSPVTNVIPPDVTHTATVGDASITTSGSSAAVLKVIEATKVPVALALFLAISFGLTACVGTPAPATVAVSLATAQTDANMALALYGIGKGIAQAAELTNSALVPMVNAAIVIGDQVAAKVQTALADASADASMIEDLVTQLKMQANALTIQGAPSIKVVPAAP